MLKFVLVGRQVALVAIVVLISADVEIKNPLHITLAEQIRRSGPVTSLQLAGPRTHCAEATSGVNRAAPSNAVANRYAFLIRFFHRSLCRVSHDSAQELVGQARREALNLC